VARGDRGDSGGDPANFLPPAAVLATLLVIAGDIMLFAGLLFAFWVLRLAAPVWPPPLQPRLPLGVTALSTFILLASAPAMAVAVRGLRGRDRARFLRGLAAAGLLGGLFLLIQGYEWSRLIGYGLTVTAGVYGGLFYTLIGAHAVHVVAALGWLGATLVMARGERSGAAPAARVNACALYWYFVVALWPVLYVFVYLV
jgi:heme/copper-type cytochrome/quinol oxidase subunit 3